MALTVSAPSMARCVLLLGLFAGLPSPAPAAPPIPGGDVPDLPEAFQPAWADAPPLRVLRLDFDSALSDIDNGEVLKDTMQSLIPGDLLEVGDGVWNVNPFFNLSVVASAQAPIRVVAAPGAKPLLTRPNHGQNVLNLGSSSLGPIRYFLLRGFEITGGSTGLRIYDGSQVWIDDCHIHHVAGVGLSANSVDTNHLFLTRNEISHTSSSGEGMYLGGNNGSVRTAHSVIARNYIHHTGGSQGDGIELKQGSFDNWIVENRIHATKYPCLLIYGTDGEAINRIERNVLWDANQVVLQVQGEALVHNNLILGGTQGIESHDHQGDTRDLELVHNTVICSGDAARLGDWHDRPGMVLANNALYSQNGEAVRINGGCSGVVVEGNVAYGPVVGCSTGWIPGAGLSDFAGASWDGSLQDVTPVPGSSLLSTADLGYVLPLDWTGMNRGGFPSVGAAEPGAYGQSLGPGLAGYQGLVPRLATNAAPLAGDSTFQVRLEQARPLTAAYLLTGPASSPKPFRGGIWYTQATGLVRVDTTPQGRALADLPLDGFPAGVGGSLVAQWIVFDPDAPEFYSLSPGVLWTLQ